MVNLVLQQKNSGCAVLNGPGNERLTVPPVCVVYFADKDTFFWRHKAVFPWFKH